MFSMHTSQAPTELIQSIPSVVDMHRIVILVVIVVSVRASDPPNRIHTACFQHLTIVWACACSKIRVSREHFGTQEAEVLFLGGEDVFHFAAYLFDAEVCCFGVCLCVCVCHSQTVEACS